MTAGAHSEQRNLWDESRERRPVAPALSSDISVDVAVIGAGYTGLAAAYHLKCAEPALEVAVLEAETCGFGASGRNAGFVMTLFGASLGQMVAQHGKARMHAAHEFMQGAIDALAATIAGHKLDCDFERSGFLKVATAPAYVARIRKEIATVESMGVEGFEWLDADAVRERVNSPTFLGGCYEAGCGLINPVKWVDALRRIAVAKGARLFEGTRVETVQREGGSFRLTAARGTVRAQKVVFATNGYTHLIPGMRFKQIPAFAYIIATEPLSQEQRAALRWAGREGLEDARNFMHFFRLTPDNRLLAGGGPGVVPFAGNMHHDASPKAWAHLASFIATTFPVLRGIRITHRWGGAFSVTLNSTPQIGTLHGGAAVYSVGCTGHGVAMTHQNGAILADLVLGRRTELSELWFVNRRSLPFPPEPLRFLGTKAVTGMMALDDWWCERGAT